jgi:hypothetical protein
MDLNAEKPEAEYLRLLVFGIENCFYDTKLDKGSYGSLSDILLISFFTSGKISSKPTTDEAP